MRIRKHGSKVSDTKVNERGEGLGDERAVAVGGINLEAEETRMAGADDARQRIQRRLGGFRLQMIAVDPPHFSVAPCPGGGAAGRGGTQVAEVQVFDAGGIEVGGEGGLGEPRTP